MGRDLFLEGNLDFAAEDATEVGLAATNAPHGDLELGNSVCEIDAFHRKYICIGYV